MRRFAAILLFVLYTFNLIGYQVFFHWAEQAVEQQLQASLDRDEYSSNDLITIRVPLSLPYITDSKSFERVDGEVMVDGEIYHFVKRGIQNGQVVFLCLPDHQKMKIESAKEDFFRLAADLQHSKLPKKSSDSKADVLKLLKAKYSQPLAETELLTLQATIRHINYYSLPLTPVYIGFIGQPPKLS